MNFSRQSTKPFVKNLPNQSHDAVRDIDLIPMINVVFLLLIFFMVAGVFRSADDAEVTLPATQLAIVQQDTQSTQVSIDVEGRVFIDGTETEDINFSDAIKTLDVAIPLVVRADSNAPANTVFKVFSEARAAGFTELALQAVSKPKSALR